MRGWVEERGKRNGRMIYRVRYQDPRTREWHTEQNDPDKAPDDPEPAFTNRRRARDHLADIRRRMERGEWVDPRKGETPLHQWAEQWLRTKRRLTPKTVEGYMSLLRSRILPTFGDASLTSIQRVQIEAWVAGMESEGLSPSRIRQAYRVLSAMLRSAVVNGLIVRSPAMDIELPRMPRVERLFLSAEQVATLADAIHPNYEALIYVLGYGGLRFGEAAALRVKRIDVLRRRIIVEENATTVGGELVFGETKNHSTRAVSVPRFVMDKLAAHLEENVEPSPDALVFTNLHGRPLRADVFPRGPWQTALKHTALPAELTPHELRHTAASLLIAQGAGPKSVQAHIGHSTIAITFDIYGHLFPDHLDDVMDALDEQHREAQAEQTHTRSTPGEGERHLRAAE